MSEEIVKRKYSSDPSERARQLVAEGKIGGARPGSGRPRKQRAAEIIAEKTRREADKVWAAFKDALHPDNPHSIRLAAAKELIQLEHRESELQLKEDVAFEDTSREELIAFIQDGLSALVEAGQIDDSFIDSSAIALGEIPEGTS